MIGYAVFGLLDVRFSGKPYPVTVELDSAGGIFEGAEVATGVSAWAGCRRSICIPTA